MVAGYDPSVTIRYDPANPWSVPAAGHPQPGNVLLMEFLIARFGGTNLGIYNNRPKRGGLSPSIHRDGRACNWNQPDMVLRLAAVNFLITHAEILQVQSIHIYETNQIWRCGVGWHTQSGSRDPAWGARWADWCHVELNWKGSSNTVPVATLIAGSTPKPPIPVPPPVPQRKAMSSLILIEHPTHGLAELVFNDDGKSIIAIGAEPFDKNDDHVTEAYGNQAYSTATKGFRGMEPFDVDEIRTVKLDLSASNIKLMNGWKVRPSF